MKYNPYSFSKIHTFLTCPLQFKFRYIDKVAVDRDYSDPIFFVRGRFIHNYLAEVLNGKEGMLSGYKDIPVEDKMDLIENAHLSLEDEIFKEYFDYELTEIERFVGYDENLNPSFSKPYLMKGFIDFYGVNENKGFIIDWKSGNLKNNPQFDQLLLYAIWLFERYDELETIDLIFYYIEHQKYNKQTVDRNQVKEFKGAILEIINKIENENEFKKVESNACDYCPFKSRCENSSKD